MSARWTGYGIIVWPRDPDEPRCRFIRIDPCHMPTIEKAIHMAESIWISSGMGRDYSGIVIDRWEAGKIAEPRVWCMPEDFNDMVERNNLMSRWEYELDFNEML